MKNFDSRTYSINDFLEWERNGQLELSPKFQRRSVWTDYARSYLMDTIIRGKPIPKVFIRQTMNPQTRQSIREVVDGQQRLRTIISFLKDGFFISRKHNSEYGGIYFSQLDEEIQTFILNYEVSVDLLVNQPDEEILDIFSRLNSYSVTLNTQEKINANHFGPFKILADRVAHKYNHFWLQNGIITEQSIMRMEDVSLVSDLLIAMIEGIQEKKKIEFHYDKYEKVFDENPVELENQFDQVMRLIQDVFPSGLRTSSFKRIHIFYSLFLAFYHDMFGLSGISEERDIGITQRVPQIENRLGHIDEIMSTEDVRNLSEEDSNFLNNARRATTDKSVRVKRTVYILRLLKSYVA